MSAPFAAGRVAVVFTGRSPEGAPASAAETPRDGRAMADTTAATSQTARRTGEVRRMDSPRKRAGDYTRRRPEVSRRAGQERVGARRGARISGHRASFPSPSRSPRAATPGGAAGPVGTWLAEPVGHEPRANGRAPQAVQGHRVVPGEVRPVGPRQARSAGGSSRRGSD